MAMNFPSSPTVGQVFEAEGLTFIWTGAVWQLVGSTGGGSSGPSTVVAATPPANPKSGQLWFKTVAPVGLYIWLVDADSSQWVQTAGGVGSISASAASLSKAQSDITKLKADVVKMKAVDAEKELLITNLNLKVASLQTEEDESERIIADLLVRVQALEARP